MFDPLRRFRSSSGTPSAMTACANAGSGIRLDSLTVQSLSNSGARTSNSSKGVAAPPPKPAQDPNIFRSRAVSSTSFSQKQDVQKEKPLNIVQGSCSPEGLQAEIDCCRISFAHGSKKAAEKDSLLNDLYLGVDPAVAHCLGGRRHLGRSGFESVLKTIHDKTRWIRLAGGRYTALSFNEVVGYFEKRLDMQLTEDELPQPSNVPQAQPKIRGIIYTKAKGTRCYCKAYVDNSIYIESEKTPSIEVAQGMKIVLDQVRESYRSFLEGGGARRSFREDGRPCLVHWGGPAQVQVHRRH